VNNIFQSPKLRDVHKILEENDLPTDDLSEINLSHFFGCGETANPRGVIGLEVYGSDGLLRSLAVDPEVQGFGCGSSLFLKLEQHSKSIGIKTLYLLTETAEEYFKAKGFDSISRELASESIKQTREFSDLCPGTATLMRKSVQS